MIKKVLVILSAVTILSGCSLFTPSPRTDTFMINTVPHVHKNHARNVSIAVTQPVSAPIYDTADMAYSTYAYEISYFSKNAWAETPAQMLQPLMVQTLLNTHHFKWVSSSAALGTADYVLNSQLLMLQQDFRGGRSAVHLSMRLHLVRNSTNQVVASKDISVVRGAPYNSPYGGVIAANRAAEEMLHEMAKFCERRT